MQLKYYYSKKHYWDDGCHPNIFVKKEEVVNFPEIGCAVIFNSDGEERKARVKNNSSSYIELIDNRGDSFLVTLSEIIGCRLKEFNEEDYL